MFICVYFAALIFQARILVSVSELISNGLVSFRFVSMLEIEVSTVEG